MFKANAGDGGKKHGSFYLQSKIYRAKEAVDAARGREAPPAAEVGAEQEAETKQEKKA